MATLDLKSEKSLYRKIYSFLHNKKDEVRFAVLNALKIALTCWILACLLIGWKMISQHPVSLLNFPVEHKFCFIILISPALIALGTAFQEWFRKSS